MVVRKSTTGQLWMLGAAFLIFVGILLYAVLYKPIFSETADSDLGEGPILRTPEAYEAPLANSEIANDVELLPTEAPAPPPGKTDEQTTKTTELSVQQAEKAEIEFDGDEPLPILTAEIRGTVYGPSGKGVPGVTVYFRNENSIWRSDHPYVKSAANEKSESITDEGGHYTMTRVVMPERQLINISTLFNAELNLKGSESKVVTVRPAALIDGIDFHPERIGSKEFTLFAEDMDGDPVSGIGMSYESNTARVSKYRGVTDGKGTVVFGPLPDDESIGRIRVNGNDHYEGSRLTVDIRKENPFTYTLTEKTTGSIILRPEDPETGNYLAAFSFTLYHMNPQHDRWRSFRPKLSEEERFKGSIYEGKENLNRAWDSMVDRPDGNLEISSMRRGKWYVEITELELADRNIYNPEGWESPFRPVPLRRGRVEFEITPTTPSPLIVHIPVEQGITLNGRLLDLKEGTPIPDHRVRLIREAKEDRIHQSKSVQSDSQGNFMVPHLTPGEFRMWAEGDTNFSLDIENTLIRGDSPVTEVELRVPKTAELHGAISGIPAEHYTSTSIQWYTGRESPVMSRKIKLDETGRYKMSGLKAGAGTIGVYHMEGEKTLQQRRESLQLHPGESREYNFDFSGVVEISGSVFVNDKPAFGQISKFELRDKAGLSPTDRFSVFEEGTYTAQLSPGLYYAYSPDLVGGTPPIVIPEHPKFQSMDINFETTELHVVLDDPGSKFPLDNNNAISLELHLDEPFSQRQLHGYFFANEGVVKNVIVNTYNVYLLNSRYNGSASVRIDLNESNKIILTIPDQE